MRSNNYRSAEAEPPPPHPEERTGCALPPRRGGYSALIETLRFAPFPRVRWACSDSAETFTNSEERSVSTGGQRQ